MASPRYTVFTTYIVHGYTKTVRTVPREISVLISCFFGKYFRVVAANDCGTHGTAAGYVRSSGASGRHETFVLNGL